MPKHKEVWINKYGAISRTYDTSFDAMTKGIEDVLKKYQGRMSFKEMYQVANVATVSAVANLVRARVNNPKNKKQK